MNEGMKHEFTSAERAEFPYHHIDPGFINVRKCLSAFGPALVREFDALKKPGSDHWDSLYNNHLLVNLCLAHAARLQAQPLGVVIQSAKIGDLFCSTETLAGAGDDVYEKDTRVKNRVVLPYEDRDVYLEFGTDHFVASTGKLEQVDEQIVSIIGQVRNVSEFEIVLNPLIMGAPSLDHPFNKNVNIDPARLAWEGFEWYEILPEDVDEFAKAKDVAEPTSEEWTEYMKNHPEANTKRKLCEILGDIPKADWGGEQHDHFSASLHLQGKRVSAAFVLKGPAQFREMTLDMLGKRADQIHRLATSTARLLIVQHAHDIGEAVRSTLRAFAVSPHQPRRYCLIDGKATYKILKAYDKL
jgi:hypothetical protein